MSNDHPITPPPELVLQWDAEAATADMPDQVYIATQAARWGADQELEACFEILRGGFNYHHLAEPLRAARRPKPPSLKEQALQAWAAVEAGTDDQTAMAVIRRALEQLDD